ncbi:hypothetical protein TESG_07135 [Trichophyton tonsurans CBS 112818]|uniref:Calcineurin-like phosphoesterase domain-containing protein n=1 Tax=Trichophyton tonsurans (strain CBS 112818) TaxID=647933 RepID=F2S899_TRIT1|nr:hypothetical protein TESG_07135 [Trichophyton tonsurans CBS 112818]
MVWRRSGGLDALVRRPVPTRWDRFITSPISFLASLIYEWRSSIPARPIATISDKAITVVCISDTHMTRPHIPDGDILLHSGDLTQSGSKDELQQAHDWLNTLPHQHKVIIAGNHDSCLDPSFKMSKTSSDSGAPQKSIDWGNVIYLQNTSIILDCFGHNINIFGSPVSPKHGNWAFQYPRKENVWEDVIPPDTDILLTHTPPHSHLDLSFGCKFLLQELWRLKHRPILHVFGHIHGGYGQHMAYFDNFQSIYESIIKGDASIVSLLFLIYEAMKVLLWRAPAPGTRMVNASMVGGVRDELTRDATVLHI